MDDKRVVLVFKAPVCRVTKKLMPHVYFGYKALNSLAGNCSRAASGS